MRNYRVVVDGYTVGIESFTHEEVKAIEADAEIKLILVEE